MTQLLTRPQLVMAEMNQKLADYIDCIIHSLTVTETIADRLNPGHLTQYRDTIQELPKLTELAASFNEAKFGKDDQYAFDCAKKAGQLIEKGLGLIRGDELGQKALFKVFRSFRFFARAKEAIYPLLHAYPVVDKFFRERTEVAQAAELNRLDDETIDRGIMDAHNARDKRGGFHLYVPEYYDGNKPMPLVIALHGGSGHGADFLWSWLPEARSRGCILLSPSSKGNTWSMQNPAIDVAGLKAMLEYVHQNYNVDKERTLLTGISDGGTFALIAAVVIDASPFTHFAPVASAAQAVAGAAERLKGKSIYMVHGVLDWMFPVEAIRRTADTLKAGGVNLTYREIDDLSHNYPRDENSKILDWFLG